MVATVRDNTHAWFLLTYGIAEVDLGSLKPIAVLGRGFPKWMAKLLDLGNGFVGATGWTGQTLTVVDTSRRFPFPGVGQSAAGGAADRSVGETRLEHEPDLGAVRARHINRVLHHEAVDEGLLVEVPVAEHPFEDPSLLQR